MAISSLWLIAGVILFGIVFMCCGYALWKHEDEICGYCCKPTNDNSQQNAALLMPPKRIRICSICIGKGFLTCDVCGGNGSQTTTNAHLNYQSEGGVGVDANVISEKCKACNGQGRTLCVDCGGIVV
eukprot:472837_1